MKYYKSTCKCWFSNDDVMVWVIGPNNKCTHVWATGKCVSDYPFIKDDIKNYNLIEITKEEAFIAVL